jgi:hypothetical protein
MYRVRIYPLPVPVTHIIDLIFYVATIKPFDNNPCICISTLHDSDAIINSRFIFARVFSAKQEKKTFVFRWLYHNSRIPKAVIYICQLLARGLKTEELCRVPWFWGDHGVGFILQRSVKHEVKHFVTIPPTKMSAVDRIVHILHVK